jgi:hypothetical protein
MTGTLTDIRRKVRRLTGRPSVQQITDAQIDEYINTFYLYDMPETLRLFSQESVFEFMTEANVDQYDLSTMTVYTGVINEIVGDYYINLKPPIFIAGYQSFWSQDREQFFRIYPQLAQIVMTVTGNGGPGPYTTTFPNVPVLQNLVTVGAIDDTDAAANCIDVPSNRTDGTWQLINTNTAVTGSVNYITGAISITFPNNIPSGNEITFTAVPYQDARPLGALYYDDILTLRPVPDASYLVQINAYKRPTSLISSGEFPELKQWWQYLAFGAAKKIFEDSQDPNGVKSILEPYKEQERLVLRRTIVQRTTQRSATIYTEMTNFPLGNFNGRF